MKILAIGEIIFDIFGNEAVIGGAPLNFCAHCVACGAKAALVSGVGNDEYGDRALEIIKDFGVETAFIGRNSFEPGKCIVTVENGNPSFNVLRPSAYDAIDADVVAIKEYGAEIFAFGTLIQREETSRNAVRSILAQCDFKEIFCDINLRQNCYDRESCLLCLENATILKLSDEEEPLLAEFGFYDSSQNEEELLANIASRFSNLRLVILTKGENGSLVYDAVSKKFERFEAVSATVISTVGAGDSYSAAFLCEYLESRDVSKAGRAGAERSALVVSQKGAII